MNHPLLKNPVFLIWYYVFWIILSVVQFFIDVRVFEANLSITLVDVIISNVIYSMLGLGIWYVVTGVKSESKSQIYLVLYHLFAMLFIVSFWMWVTHQIDMALFNSADVKAHMKLVLPGKASLGVLIYVLIAVFYYTFYYFNLLKEKSKEESKLRELITQTQLNELKSQINPHFLFNSLNSVSYLTIAEPEKAQEMVIKLSTFLRYSLKHKENQLVSLSQEIEHIKLYLDIEKVRFGDKLNALFDLIDCNGCMIPNMILQPLYENAIKYGVYETTEQVTIQTTARRDNQQLYFTVSNNFDPDSISKKGEGIGLRNIRKRLGLVYGDSTLLTVKNENQIFTATLRIPQK
ncbi:MAG TPA: histidine kinase [Prolixibacteraceae bacterium]|nr:histidine kinase [Prolixibacteraceae bacterium]